MSKHKRKPLRGGVLEMIAKINAPKQPRSQNGQYAEVVKQNKPPVKMALFLLTFMILHTVPGFEKVMDYSIDQSIKYGRLGLETAWTHIQNQAKRQDYKRVEIFNPVVAFAAVPSNSNSSKAEPKEDTRLEECTGDGGTPIVLEAGFQCAYPATEPVKITG